MSKLLNPIYLVIIRDTAKVARVPSTSCRGKDPVKRGIIFCLCSLSICYAFCPFNNFIFTIFWNIYHLLR